MLAYTLGEDWSLVDGFYFAIATLTTSSIADPELVLTSAWLKDFFFTAFYVLVGIGILVEVARQLGFAMIELRQQEHGARLPLRQRNTQLRTTSGHAGLAGGCRASGSIQRRVRGGDLLPAGLRQLLDEDLDRRCQRTAVSAPRTPRSAPKSVTATMMKNPRG